MHPLLDRFDATCAERPAHRAACDAHLTLDYRSFRAVAAGLAKEIHGVTERPRVGVLAPPSVACAAAIFGCWYAGRTPTPLNFLLAPNDLRRIITDAGIDRVLTVGPFVPLAEAAGLGTLVLDADTLHPREAAAPDAAPGDHAALIYTSGTSGDPKGVVLTFDNLVQNVTTCIAAAGITPDQAFLSLLPQFHAFGFTTNTLVPLLLGATVRYVPRFTPTQVVNLIAEERIAVFITIASMFGALAAMKDVRREQLASLRLPVSGGEPLPPRVVQAFRERFGLPIYEGYGMTEASPVVTLNTPQAHRVGTVGRPLAGVEVVAADAQGQALPSETDGELLVRGHCVMQGYFNKPEQTADVIRDGWLWTGDVGRVDTDGFVTITGRAKDMMIVGGENVFPFEIESVLVEHPAVAEVAVVGQRDTMRGEVPVAFVILRTDAPSVSSSDLRTLCRERLPAYKVPRQIVFAENLPRGPTGKILKRALQVPKEAGGSPDVG